MKKLLSGLILFAGALFILAQGNNFPLTGSVTIIPTWSNTATLYVDVNGNDNTAKKGLLPWQTITGAVANAVSGDMIKLENGTFVTGTNIVVLPAGVSMKGNGPGLSIISATKHVAGNKKHCQLIPGNNSVLKDFSLIGDGLLTAIGVYMNDLYTFTNVLCDNISVAGVMQAISLCPTSSYSSSNYSITIQNSSLTALTVVQVGCAGTGSGTTAIFYNDILNADITAYAQLSDTPTVMVFDVCGGNPGPILVANCTGRIYATITNAANQQFSPGEFLLYDCNAPGQARSVMNNCVWDFTSPMYVSGMNYSNYWPAILCPVPLTVSGTSNVLTQPGYPGTANNGIMGTNGSITGALYGQANFFNVSCIYSNLVLNCTLSQYLTNTYSLNSNVFHAISVP